eukprot:scaffold14483_cov207-Alexandrium_tamarense.AAC.2
MDCRKGGYTSTHQPSLLAPVTFTTRPPQTITEIQQPHAMGVWDVLALAIALSSSLKTSDAFAPSSRAIDRLPSVTSSVAAPCSSSYYEVFNKSTNMRPPLQASAYSVSEPLAIFASQTVTPNVNIALISLSITILLGYHINLLWKEFKSNSSGSSCSKTWRQYQADTREDWARHVRETEGWLYAIQSLRNAMTAQTFLASTVLSLLTLITGKMWDILRAASTKYDRRLLTVQLASIATTMLLSAYQFLQGVRLMTHAGFMFPVKKDTTKVDNIMRQTQNCQWLGLRWMYVSLAPISWVVGGSRAYLVVSLLLLQFFRTIDKQPEGLGYEEFQAENI